MQEDHEPIIATRPRRQLPPEEPQPLWRLALALGSGVAIVALLAWWFLGRSSDDDALPAIPEESPPPEIRIEPTPALPTHEFETSADVTQAPAPPASNEQQTTAEDVPEDVPEDVVENDPAIAPDDSAGTSSPPATVSLRLTSPDAQVQFEVHDPLDSSRPLTSKAGDVVDLAPGTYRVVASGTQLETLEREITLTGEHPAEYTVELCAQPRQEAESVAGQIIEQRTCASTVECESTFMILSEQAEQLVKDRAFRTQQCAKWRPTAAPDGTWTLDIKCAPEASTTTCRIEIADGSCTVTGPRRSVRGEACPRAELN